MRFKLVFLISAVFLLSSLSAFSQSDAGNLYKKAQAFIQSGDYGNAIILLKRSVELEPASALYTQTLAYAYSLNRNYKEAEKIIKPVLKSDAANVQTYQIAGNIYKAEMNNKAARKNYQRGLKRFPESGTLYSELGQVYYDEKDYTRALQSWIKGIQTEPDYSLNYYFAARTYYYSKDKFWTLIYGEMFINLERFTNRTSEMKKMLLDSYKSIINKSITLSLTQNSGDSRETEDDGFSTIDKPDFRKAVLITLGKSADASITNGVTPESMVMTRTHFLLNWDHFYKLIYPYALFDYYRMLLSHGLFEAYNQWIFGPADNPATYKIWVEKHTNVMHELIDFLNNHSFKPVQDQFYQKEKIDFVPASVSK